MIHGSRSLLAVLVLIGGSVTLSLADDKMPATPYYPLNVGDTWTYRAGDNRFSLKVAEIKTVEGKPRAKVELLVNNKAVSSEQIGVTKDGVVRYTFEGKEAKPPIEFLKLPPKPDVTWKIDSEVIETAPNATKHTVKGSFKSGKEEEVKVTAGTYKAVTVTGQDIEADGVKIQKLTYYFAENVGMVKQVIELEGNTIVIELETYEPVKKQ